MQQWVEYALGNAGKRIGCAGTKSVIFYCRLPILGTRKRHMEEPAVDQVMFSSSKAMPMVALRC